MNPIITSFLTIHGVITYITLTNSCGASVTLSTCGAGIISVCVPDKSGTIGDVLLGYNEAESYYNDGPAMGKIPGRYANRIGYGKAEIDGETANLIVNLPPHCLHGGGEPGLHNKIWTLDSVSESSVRMSVISPDGDAGFPGELTATAIYSWNEDNTLSLRMEAETTRTTIVNLTNHAYFNLKGATAGTALDHLLTIKASSILETDSTLLPTGRLTDVSGTPMDFRSMHTLRERIENDYQPLIFAKGYDHCFVIDGYEPGKVQTIAVIEEPSSGRILEILSDQPGAQLYTANWMEGAPEGKGGYIYKDYDGIAIEPQDFPDAPNRPEFPSTILKPEQKYERTIIFKFKTL